MALMAEHFYNIVILKLPRFPRDELRPKRHIGSCVQFVHTQEAAVQVKACKASCHDCMGAGAGVGVTASVAFSSQDSLVTDMFRSETLRFKSKVWFGEAGGGCGTPSWGRRRNLQSEWHTAIML